MKSIDLKLDDKILKFSLKDMQSKKDWLASSIPFLQMKDFRQSVSDNQDPRPELWKRISFCTLDSRTGYHFCSETPKINRTYRFSIQVLCFLVPNLQFLSLFRVHRCDLQINFGRNSRTGSIFRDHLTLGTGRLLTSQAAQPRQFPRVHPPPPLEVLNSDN